MGLIDEIRCGEYVPVDDAVVPFPGKVSTLADAGARIAAGEDPLVASREFLDQVPRLSALEILAAIAERPLPTGDARGEALLGALAEHLATRLDTRAPFWTLEPERFLDRLWFVSRESGFRAVALAQTPVALKRRGVLWPARSLARV